MMKRVYFWMGIILIALYSCTKENETDLTNVPASVQKHISQNCTCEPRIGLFRWRDREIYVHWFIGPSCMTVASFYDEKGNKRELTTEEHTSFWAEKELVRMIWVCGE